MCLITVIMPVNDEPQMPTHFLRLNTDKPAVFLLVGKWLFCSHRHLQNVFGTEEYHYQEIDWLVLKAISS